MLPGQAGHVSVCSYLRTRSAGKWPASAAALRKVKAALGVQLAHALEKGHGLMCRVSEHFVDVLTDGFAFRVHLYCSRCAACFHVNDSVTPPLSDVVGIHAEMPPALHQAATCGVQRQISDSGARIMTSSRR
jgi:hypothetical protein